MEDAIKDLDKLLRDLEKAARDAAANPNNKRKQDELDDVIHKLGDVADDIADAARDNEDEDANMQKKALGILASLKGAKKRSMDPRTLLEAADDLAGALSGLLGDVTVQAYAQPATTDRAKKALELNDLLAELDAAAKGPAKTKPTSKADLDGLLKGLSDLADAAVPAPGASLEESLSHWAEAIQHRSKTMPNDPTSSTTAKIGEQLAKLAEAARTGQKSEFLVAARTISALIRTYNKELRGLANNCPDPQLKERLIQNGQALKNFSIQLKIMASVKAASTGDDPTAESQLADRKSVV